MLDVGMKLSMPYKSEIGTDKEHSFVSFNLILSFQDERHENILKI